MSNQLHADLNWDQVTKRVSMMPRGPSNGVAFKALDYLHAEVWPDIEPLGILHMLHGDSRVVVAAATEHKQQKLMDMMGI
jgi:hypothetical protein